MADRIGLIERKTAETAIVVRGGSSRLPLDRWKATVTPERLQTSWTWTAAGSPAAS